MKRREFIAASAAVGMALGAPLSSGHAAVQTDKQLLELRRYSFKSSDKQQDFDKFLAKVVVPALNRIDIKPVGVFALLPADNRKLGDAAKEAQLFILMPHNSSESFIKLVDRLGTDGEFLDAGRDILEAPKSDPAYVRYESTLMLAFDGVPRVKIPTRSADRVFQLRIYESHNTERAERKIHMFNEGGELEIFDRCGMDPVFFGQALIGARLPNLTYMLGFENMAALDKGWNAFRNDAGWKVLRKDETYKDTVSNITNLVLRPTASSQI